VLVGFACAAAALVVALFGIGEHRDAPEVFTVSSTIVTLVVLGAAFAMRKLGSRLQLALVAAWLTLGVLRAISLGAGDPAGWTLLLCRRARRAPWGERS